jgi:hypothetical protein
MIDSFILDIVLAELLFKVLDILNKFFVISLTIEKFGLRWALQFQ